MAGGPWWAGRTGWASIAAGAAAVVTAVGTLIGGLGTAGVIGREDDPPRATQSAAATAAATTASPTTAATPTAAATATTATASPALLPFRGTPAEERLARLVPLVLQPDCARGQPLSVPTDGNLFCQPSDGTARAAYHLFPSGTAASAYMASRVGLGDTGQRCGESASGSSTYSDARGETVGRLVCYLRDGWAWIEWTNLRAAVYAYAYRQDEDWQRLYAFWTTAGPAGPPA